MPNKPSLDVFLTYLYLNEPQITLTAAICQTVSLISIEVVLLTYIWTQNYNGLEVKKRLQISTKLL